MGSGTFNRPYFYTQYIQLWIVILADDYQQRLKFINCLLIQKKILLSQSYSLIIASLVLRLHIIKATNSHPVTKV
jgi:hypothetical protein